MKKFVLCMQAYLQDLLSSLGILGVIMGRGTLDGLHGFPLPAAAPGVEIRRGGGTTKQGVGDP